MDRLHQRSHPIPTADDAAALFHRHRAARSERSQLLGTLLVVLEPDHSLELRRAPDVRAACDHAYGAADGGSDGDGGRADDGTSGTCVSLTELGGVLSAYQWHQRGVEIDALDALDARIHPTYGVLTGARRVHRPG